MINKKFGLPDDNFAEEVAELAIEEYTGVELDLSPSSEED
jgi:hypothetical protein